MVRVLTRAFGRTTKLVWKGIDFSEAPRTLSSRGRNESSPDIFQAGPLLYSMWEEGRADTHSGCQRWAIQYILSTFYHCTLVRQRNSRGNQGTDSLASIWEMRAGSISMTAPPTLFCCSDHCTISCEGMSVSRLSRKPVVSLNLA